MIGFKLKDAQALFFDRKAIVSRFAKQTLKVFRQFGGYVRKVARNSIKDGDKVSKPGRPPTNRTGLLKNGIFFAADPAAQSVVQGPVKLNKPTNAAAVLEHGGSTTIVTRVSATDARRVRKRIRIKPRPYMGPAFSKGQAKLPQFWRESVQ